MRPHETAGDRSVPADVYIVARLDGRGFTRLRVRLDVEGPVDLRVRDVLIATADHLMHCVEVTYGFTHGDGIVLLLRRDEMAFGRDPRRLVAALAGEASAKLSLLLGELACFDCRIVELPDAATVVDYFGWRQAEATREALAAQREWALDVLPDWHRYGAGLHWARHEQRSAPPLSQRSAPVLSQRSAPVLSQRAGLADVPALRRRLRVELELPHGEAYAAFVRDQVDRAGAPEP